MQGHQIYVLTGTSRSRCMGGVAFCSVILVPDLSCASVCQMIPSQYSSSLARLSAVSRIFPEMSWNGIEGLVNGCFSQMPIKCCTNVVSRNFSKFLYLFVCLFVCLFVMHFTPWQACSINK